MAVKAQARRTIKAPKDVVWEVLDDFPNIAAWSAGIKKSYTPSDRGDADQATGLGAERVCELGGKKRLDERISEYVEGESMTIDVWNVEGLPLKSSQAKFSVRSLDDGTTEATIDAEASPKLPGFLVALMRPVLVKGISKQFGGLLDELGVEAESRVKA